MTKLSGESEHCQKLSSGHAILMLLWSNNIDSISDNFFRSILDLG